MASMGPHCFAARLRGLGAACAALALAIWGAAVIAAADDAGAQKPSITVLGAAAPAASSCTPSQCVVEARVTGFATRIGPEKRPFAAKFSGKVVAWSIKLGTPSVRDERCLTEGCETGPNTRFEGFGGSARARISILKPIRKEIKAGRPIYKLVRQSPVEELTDYFGTTTTFALRRPLPINATQIVAVTIPTWAPLFSGGASAKSSWRASRKRTTARGGCTSGGPDAGANVNAGSPLQNPGKQRFFGCVYGGNRLLYSATIVPGIGS